MWQRGPLSDQTYLHPGSVSFGFADSRFIERSVVDAGRHFRRTLLQLLDDLASGAINLQGFTRGANRALLVSYTSIYSLGALSVDPFHILTHQDTEILQREIAHEQRFLKAFGREMDRGFYVLNPQIRANLYLYSLRGIFELGRIYAMPYGGFNWILGDTHHCDPCIAAATGGPYRRSRYERQDLPELPGVPGFGDLCLGFTRCGCYLRPVGSAQEPGQDSQERIRGLLAEIAHGSS